MKRKLLAGLLCVALLVGVLPVQALAIDYPSPAPDCPSLGSNDELEDDTYYLLDEEGGLTTEGASEKAYHLYYDSETKTLTLNNAQLQDALYVDGGTTVNLVGTNASGSTEKPVSIGIQGMSAGAITIEGDGAYTVYTTYEAIATVEENEADAPSDILIHGGTINTNGEEISTRYGNLTIDGNAVVTAGAVSCGNVKEESAGFMTVGGDAQVTAISLDSQNDMTIGDQAVVNVTNANGIAVNSGKDLTITDAARVTATGKNGALNTFSGNITISSREQTSVTVTDTSRGYAAVSMGLSDVEQNNLMTVTGNLISHAPLALASSNGDIIIDGAQIVADNVSVSGVTSKLDDITIQNGAGIQVTGQTNGAQAGVMAKQGALTVKDSTVSVTQAAQGMDAAAGVTLENSSVELETTSSAFSKKPQLTYDELYKITAGEGVENATVIDSEQADDETFQNKYVKVEPMAAVPATEVTLDQTTLQLYSNAEPKSGKLTATVTPANTTDNVKWTTDNDAVATVDANGLVTAVGDGTATITATAGAASAQCEVMVSTYSSGAPTYDIDVQATGGGALDLSHKFAVAGATVRVTAQPEEGYKLERLTVTDADGAAVEVKPVSDNRYTFKMPKSNVTVAPQFVRDGASDWPFTDVDTDDWFYEPVRYVYDNGIMTGTSDSEFSPNLATTRGMFVTMLYRLEGEPDLSDENLGYPFADVDASAYYADAVYWARMNGIASGMSNEIFAPNASLTREQLAAMLQNYAAWKGRDVSKRADLSAYSDAAAVSGWATDAVEWAVAEGVISGVSPDTLAPQGAATRGQVAAMLQRFLSE